MAKLYQILAILAILGTVSPHFKSDNGEIWHVGAGLKFPPHTKFCKKIAEGDILFFGQIYTKN